MKTAETLATTVNIAIALVQSAQAAHATTTEAGGPMELLAREALADAVRLRQRMQLLHQFAAEAEARAPARSAEPVALAA